MTERNTAKIKRSDDGKPSRKSAIAGSLETEIVRLRSELAAAHLRIAELEKQQADVINRIDWVIDSLHNLTDSN